MATLPAVHRFPMKEAASLLVPEWLRMRIRLERMRREWRRAGTFSPCAQPPSPPSRLFIIPSDPRTPFGSRGDDAMLRSVVDTLRARRADLSVSMSASSDTVVDAGERIHMVPETSTLAGFVDAIRRAKPDALVVIGADVMDGHYGPLFTARRLLAADLMAREGVPTVITGFSFNAHPHPLLARLFDVLDQRVCLHVRDPLSLRRFRAFSSRPATLVADVAFLLEPDEASPRLGAIFDWIAERRRRGERVFGLNLHPVLGGADVSKGLANAAAAALTSISSSEPVSWLLLAHDFRTRTSCSDTLAEIERLAQGRLGARLLRPTEQLSARELKAVAGKLDGVVSGRMHLAIAALGQGTPVCCVTYQGKFEGLFEHFGLPLSLLMDPQQALRAGALESLLREFVQGANAHRQQVARQWPEVRRLAAINLAPLLGLEVDASMQDAQHE
jgi:polysaccharide pyruvyl transferase WcaK-like protein